MVAVVLEFDRLGDCPGLLGERSGLAPHFKCVWVGGYAFVSSLDDPLQDRRRTEHAVRDIELPSRDVRPPCPPTVVGNIGVLAGNTEAFEIDIRQTAKRAQERMCQVLTC